MVTKDTEMKFTIRAEDIRNPLMSEQTFIGEESAAHCDGSDCGKYCEDDTGEMLDPGPHHHMVVYGVNPPTSKRRTATFTN